MLASPVDKSESSAAILRDELRQSQQSLASWQDSWRQAKGACEAWKKEAEEVAGRARMERESSRRRIEEVREREPFPGSFKSRATFTVCSSIAKFKCLVAQARMEPSNTYSMHGS